jgi:hypothetical protein
MSPPTDVKSRSTTSETPDPFHPQRSTVENAPGTFRGLMAREPKEADSTFKGFTDSNVFGQVWGIGDENYPISSNLRCRGGAADGLCRPFAESGRGGPADGSKLELRCDLRRGYGRQQTNRRAWRRTRRQGRAERSGGRRGPFHLAVVVRDGLSGRRRKRNHRASGANAVPGNARRAKEVRQDHRGFNRNQAGRCIRGCIASCIPRAGRHVTTPAPG